MGLFNLGKKEKENNTLNEQTPQGNINLNPPKVEKSAPILPLPGENLDEIKNQVINNNNNNNNQELKNNIQKQNTEPIYNQSNIPNISTQTNAQETTPQNLESKNNGDINSILNDDSLFNFSEFDFNSHTNKEEKRTEELRKTEMHHDMVSNTLKELPNLNIDSKGRKYNEPFFITTKQFKTLLELIEQIKKKVKESSETHLRLLDIMSEEDIEYDNLRKDFEFIENKLYEIDELLFDN